MTTNEAIQAVKEVTGMSLHWNDRHYEALQMALSALEKQIPKKPIRIDKNKEFDGNWKKVCPLCGRVLIERITTSEKSYPLYHNYTSHCLCGQKIDWEELN